MNGQRLATAGHLHRQADSEGESCPNFRGWGNNSEGDYVPHFRGWGNDSEGDYITPSDNFNKSNGASYPQSSPTNAWASNTQQHAGRSPSHHTS